MNTRTKQFAAILLVAMVVIAVGLVVMPTHASAAVGDTISSSLDGAASGTYDDVSLGTFAGNIIEGLLAATGIVFIIITVYAGVMYMTAAGEEAKVKKAKSMLVTSVIGLIIIIGAYAFTSFVVDELGSAASTTQTQASNP